MKEYLNKPILAEQINRLSLSASFKEMAEANGFETLSEILSFSAATLLKKPGFSMHVYLELYKILEEEKCVEMLRME